MPDTLIAKVLIPSVYFSLNLFLIVLPYQTSEKSIFLFPLFLRTCLTQGHSIFLIFVLYFLLDIVEFQILHGNLELILG